MKTSMWVSRDKDCVALWRVKPRIGAFSRMFITGSFDDGMVLDDSAFPDLKIGECLEVTLDSDCEVKPDSVVIWAVRYDDFIELHANRPLWNYALKYWQKGAPDDDTIELDSSFFSDDQLGSGAMRHAVVRPVDNVLYCQDCWEAVGDTPENRAPGLGLVCDCGCDAFYTTEEMEEIQEAMLDPEIFPVSCETCEHHGVFSDSNVTCHTCYLLEGDWCVANNYHHWTPKG